MEIIDCYTDEPSGLGVPPYLGTYPRYIAGYFLSIGHDVLYRTIDDIRFLIKPLKPGQKTNIRQYNLSVNKSVPMGQIVLIMGVHTPGKYLSAVPATFTEINRLGLTRMFKDIIISGPALYGTQTQGGKYAVLTSKTFKVIKEFSYDEIKEYSILGAKILSQIPDERIIEVELGKGCSIGNCSFCTEPIKSGFCLRPMKDIIDEIRALYNQGARHFRLGKISDFFSYPNCGMLLGSIREQFPNIKTLHIDNVNPNSVIKHKDIVSAIVKYCTPGNVASLGVESFDMKVIRENKLNTSPETSIKAIELINKIGRERGKNGMPRFLPGLNIILGLKAESRETFRINLDYLKRIMDIGLSLRRINIRQVSIFPGTMMAGVGYKFLNKNKKYYWKFRNSVRNEIDTKMLERTLPLGTVLNEVRAEIHDGNTTFCRQFGSYPIIIGVKKRLKLKEYYSVRVTGYMRRSIIGQIMNAN